MHILKLDITKNNSQWNTQLTLTDLLVGVGLLIGWLGVIETISTSESESVSNIKISVSSITVAVTFVWFSFLESNLTSSRSYCESPIILLKSSRYSASNSSSSSYQKEIFYSEKIFRLSSRECWNIPWNIFRP